MTRQNEVLKRLKQDKVLYIMVIFPVLAIFLFSYVPMFGVLIAFRKYSSSLGFIGSIIKGEWLGFKYFQQFLSNPELLKVLKNTIVLSIYSLFWGFPAPIILALSLNEVKNEKFKRITQTITYVPHFVSTVIIVGIMMQMLSPSTGIVNKIIVSMGFEPIFFFIRPEWFRTLYIGSGIWQSVGWNSIIFIATISSIDPQLYEAADMDGAGRFRKMWSITLPGLLPTIVILLLMNIGHILNVGFEKILLMQANTTFTKDVSDVIDTLVYNRGIKGGNFGFGTAVGLFKSVVGIVLLSIANSVSKRVTETSLW